jgi:hypothetical protein
MRIHFKCFSTRVHVHFRCHRSPFQHRFQVHGFPITCNNFDIPSFYVKTESDAPKSVLLLDLDGTWVTPQGLDLGAGSAILESPSRINSNNMGQVAKIKIQFY